jgi:purine nucleosidase
MRIAPPARRQSRQGVPRARVATILFDTDPGVDDTLALLYLHRHPEAKLAGITTVAGNAPIDVTTKNAQYLCERFGIAAPVARGAAAPLNGILRESPLNVHGRNGLGDVDMSDFAGVALDPRPAHAFMVDLVRARPGEITIVAVGMLTNLALALDTAPEIASLVRNVVIMGGAFGIGGHSGNVTPVAEANIHGDPRAADIVLTAPWEVTVIGLDVTERVIMTPAYLEALRDAGSAEGRFIWDVTRRYQDFHRETAGFAGIYVHDPSAAVCALDPAPFAFRRGPIRVVTDGVATGMTLQNASMRRYDPSNGWHGRPVQRVALDVDTELVLARFALPFASS